MRSQGVTMRTDKMADDQTSNRYIGSTISHWQFPVGTIIKSEGSLADIQRYLESGERILSQVQDTVTAQVLSNVLKGRAIPTARKKVHLQPGDEVIVVEAYLEVPVRNSRTGETTPQPRALHLAEGEIITPEQLAALRMRVWIYTILKTQSSGHK